MRERAEGAEQAGVDAAITTLYGLQQMTARVKLLEQAGVDAAAIACNGLQRMTGTQGGYQEKVVAQIA